MVLEQCCENAELLSVFVPCVEALWCQRYNKVRHICILTFNISNCQWVCTCPVFVCHIVKPPGAFIFENIEFQHWSETEMNSQSCSAKPTFFTFFTVKARQHGLQQQQSAPKIQNIKPNSKYFDWNANKSLATLISNMSYTHMAADVFCRSKHDVK